MEQNIKVIENIVAYIEEHLTQKLDLEQIASQSGYSKYHLHRLFTAMAGFTVHQYIQRRKLTEAARSLVFTDKPILDIALDSGYETQRSFHIAFQKLFHRSPQAYRKKKDFYPLQLMFCVDGTRQLRGDMILSTEVIERGTIRLVGYTCHTRFGLSDIGRCWKRLHTKKHLIYNRTDMDALIGLNDYTTWIPNQERQPAFAYYAAAEVSAFAVPPQGMVTKTLPPSKYMVFHFSARPQDSMQPVADFIYKEWFPQSTCQLDDSAKYDFIAYGEQADEDGKSQIAYWIPIL